MVLRLRLRTLTNLRMIHYRRNDGSLIDSLLVHTQSWSKARTIWVVPPRRRDIPGIIQWTGI
jgi:hypothetical protein